mmetsp:Transcript_6173/g.18246  ORF Transcript_6173/g.18246 Transcript_6173/m.18246 type:complete len:82 (-) Transcript_6173:124-369(-)
MAVAKRALILVTLLATSAAFTPRTAPLKTLPRPPQIVVSAANDDQAPPPFQKEKVGKLLFFALPFGLGVIDWLHHDWLVWF